MYVSCYKFYIFDSFEFKINKLKLIKLYIIIIRILFSWDLGYFIIRKWNYKILFWCGVLGYFKFLDIVGVV